MRYRRPLPSDRPAARRAKARTTEAAQKYLNNKNAIEKLTLMLCANFDHKNAHFVTLDFADDHLPATRKDTKRAAAAFFSALRDEWKRQGKELKYIYTVEGEPLATHPEARPVSSSQWEIAPWRDRDRWELLEHPDTSDETDRETPVRFHIHAFMLLDREGREAVRAFWKNGYVYANQMRVNDLDTFHRLAAYVTKDRRSDKTPNGDRIYTPSLNLERPVSEGHWCAEHEAIEAPAGADVIHQGREDNLYTSFQYCYYRMPRPTQAPEPYKSRGSLKDKHRP